MTWEGSQAFWKTSEFAILPFSATHGPKSHGNSRIDAFSINPQTIHSLWSIFPSSILTASFLGEMLKKMFFDLFLRCLPFLIKVFEASQSP